MKKIKKVTDVVRLINAVLFGVAIGLGVLRSVHETITTLAAEHEAAAKARKAAK
jgi:hypothetical protein